MTNRVLIVFIILLSSGNAFSQKWHQLSDSLLISIRSSDYEKAKKYVELIDQEISNLKIEKDTNYADFLYRKGVLASSLGDNSSKYLFESLEIYDSIKIKNFLKVMRIHYFIGLNYYQKAIKSQNKTEWNISNEHLKVSYDIVKKYKYEKQANYKLILYNLSYINSTIDKNHENASKFATEYIDFFQQKEIDIFDFDLVNVFGFKKDYEKQEELLLKYLKKYLEQNLNDQELLFNIYYQLCNNKYNFKFKKVVLYPKEVIYYGEKAIEIYSKNNLEFKLVLKNIYLILELTFFEIKDNFNSEKYNNLSKGDSKSEIYDDLDKMYKTGKFTGFKEKFTEIEKIFKSQNDFESILKIYTYSLSLFERNLLFTKDEVLKHLTFLQEHRSSLSQYDQITLDLGFAEYYAVTGEHERSLKICNLNLEVEDLYHRLTFYRYKSINEMLLGYSANAYKSSNKALEIGILNYGESHPKLLPFLLQTIKTSRDYAEKVYLANLTTKILKILYDFNLEKSEVAISCWNTLGDQAFYNNNLKDAKYYFVKAKSTSEMYGNKNPYTTYTSDLSLVAIAILNKEYQDAKDYLDKMSLYFKNNINNDRAWADLYYSWGNYYFQTDNFKEALVQYNKAFQLYGEDLSSKIRWPFIMSKYFLNNSPYEAIDEIELLLKKYGENSGLSNILYYLKYNLGKYNEAKEILIHQIEKIISNNRQYLQLLGLYESDKLFNTFSGQFELLNTYLLNADSNFLKQYIDYRVFSSTIQTTKTDIEEGNGEDDRLLFKEFKNNNDLVNSLIENKNSDKNKIENLKIRNREIEKFLFTNKEYSEAPNYLKLNNQLKLNEAYVQIIRINKQAKNNPFKATEIIRFNSDTIFYGAIIVRKNIPPKFILIDDTNKLEIEFSSKFSQGIKLMQIDTTSYQLLFKKIDETLVGINKIYLSTDGIYNFINIESIYNPIIGKYLIDYLKVQQVQNLQSITDKSNDFKINSNSKAALFGNPNFKMKIGNTNLKDTLIYKSESADGDFIKQITRDLKISTLKETEKEISNIKSILLENGIQVDFFLSDSASEDNLKKIYSPNILHIASHGYSLSNNENSKAKRGLINLYGNNYEEESYLKSGLLLAGAQNTLNGEQNDGVNNGVLSAEEAKSLHLKNTELVVLSACDTGLGDLSVGKGVIGLQRALMIAGAKGVIMSLWEVNDEITQKLMTLFYSKWLPQKMSKLDALIKAKIEIKSIYPQPYYWASFVLVE